MLIGYIIIFIIPNLYIIVIDAQYYLFPNGYTFIIFKLYMVLEGEADRFGLT